MGGIRSPGTRARITVALGAIVVAAALGEVITRQFSLVDRLNRFPRRLHLATSNPELPYRLRPGVTARVRDVTVRVNGLGLRGQETTREAPPGRRRILVLGDSIVYGEGLPEPDTFAVLLEQYLARGDGSSPEVLNGGAPGYNTESELAYLEEIGLDLHPDALVLGVSLNDYTPTPGLTPSGFLTIDPAARTHLPWLSNHSEYYMLVRWLITYARGGHWFQQLPKRPQQAPAAKQGPVAAMNEAVARMHERFYDAPSGPGWDRVRSALTGLRDLARTRQLDLTVVIFPEAYQLGVPEPNLAPQRHWLALCQELELRCLDLWPAFARATTADGQLFQDVQHPNAAGMRVAAQAVASFLGR